MPVNVMSSQRIAASKRCSINYETLRRDTIVHKISFKKPINQRKQALPSHSVLVQGNNQQLPKPTASIPQQNDDIDAHLREQRLQRRQQRVREQSSYQFAAIAASVGVSSLAICATYYRIAWHLHNGETFPFADLGGTLLFAFGGMVGMEMYARWVHRYLWHENEVGWILHKSHHEPRITPFEANDIYAIANALPAFGLTLYGFTRPDIIGGLCFGSGLGITIFGICYLFVHDGLVHRRFPVGPIANLPALKRIAVAHQLHHSEKYGGVPFGMFLGPQELEAVGAREELDRMVEAQSSSGNSTSSK